MRRRRLLTALLAVALAALSATLLTRYVQGADERALDGLSTVEVLVVTKPVAQGTAATALSGSVTTKALPRIAVAPGTLASLQDAGGRVTASALQPGEQLLDSKFVDPPSLQEHSDEVVLPAGMQEVTISLERQRMLGTTLTPGSRVGVFISLPAADEEPAQTKLAVSKVLVLAVGDAPTASTPAPGDDAPSDDAPSDDASSAPPAASMTVRLALDADDAEKVVFGAEYGRLWLSRQPDDVPADDPDVMTAEKVYR